MTTTPFAVGPLKDAEIIAHYRARTLLPQLQRPLDTNQQQALHARLAALHNAGTIDMLALTATPEFQNFDRQHFFTIQQIYHGIIPLLETPALAMLEAIQRLAQQGPNAGTPAMLVHAFCRWIGQSPGRAGDIIAVAQADASVDPEVLCEALVTLADLKLVKSLLRLADRRCRAAISALGRIKPRDLEAANEAFAELVTIAATNLDDGVRFTAIFAAFGLLKHCEANAPQWVPRLVAAVGAAPSELTRTALLQGLWGQSGLFQASDVKATLALACEADPQTLLGNLDGPLSNLIGGPHHDLAIDCLTNLLASDGKKVSLDDMPGLRHRLMTLDRTQLFALAIRWFKTGDPQLCQDVTSLVASPGHQPQPFDTTLDGWGLSGSQMITICHKAAGYLILAPIVAASFVVAALRAGDKSAEPELVQLLLQSLLINYGETVAVYLKGIAKRDEAYRPVCQALKLDRAYAEGLNIEASIKEFFPSSYQRGAVRQKHYVIHREIRKEAEQQSVFFGLTQRSTLLYGRKALTYVRGADEAPVSVEMKTVSAGVEVPRLQIIDPVGLDCLIRIFRVSRPK
jgi:hypothetical protein